MFFAVGDGMVCDHKIERGILPSGRGRVSEVGQDGSHGISGDYGIARISRALHIDGSEREKGGTRQRKQHCTLLRLDIKNYWICSLSRMRPSLSQTRSSRPKPDPTTVPKDGDDNYPPFSIQKNAFRQRMSSIWHPPVGHRKAQRSPPNHSLILPSPEPPAPPNHLLTSAPLPPRDEGPAPPPSSSPPIHLGFLIS